MCKTIAYQFQQFSKETVRLFFIIESCVTIVIVSEEYAVRVKR